MSNLLILGEAPGGPGPHDPVKHPFWPQPATGSGGRLMKMMGLHEDVFLGLTRRNLFRDYRDMPREGKHAAWCPTTATNRAERMVQDGFIRNLNVLFCSKRLARAFGHKHGELEWCDAGDYRYAIVPHPSGSNRWWNESKHRQRGYAFLRWTGAQVLMDTYDLYDAWEQQVRMSIIRSVGG